MGRLTSVRTLVAVASAVVALVIAGCVAAPTPTRPEGPSPVITGLNLDAVVAAVNGANGPTCPSLGGVLPSATTPRDSQHLGLTTASATFDCTDPGDGSTLTKSFSAGVSSELGRLQATIRMTGADNGLTDEWSYESNGIDGNLSFRVLPGAPGHYWVLLQVFEPF